MSICCLWKDQKLCGEKSHIMKKFALFGRKKHSWGLGNCAITNVAVGTLIANPTSPQRWALLFHLLTTSSSSIWTCSWNGRSLAILCWNQLEEMFCSPVCTTLCPTPCSIMLWFRRGTFEDRHQTNELIFKLNLIVINLLSRYKQIKKYA